MTTSQYLDSVLKVLPAVQARQITDMLNDLKATGEVRDADEYQAKLRELATLINDTAPKPSFEIIRGIVWHLTSSHGHNMMMKAAKNDLNALFQQVDEVGIKINDHHFLIMKHLASDMERGLTDQENTIRRLEWLANQNNEFSIALVNSFASSSLLRVPRSELGASNLYFDNRTYQIRSETELPSAVVDEYAQRLILDSTNEPMILPISVRLHTDASSYGTQVQADTDNNIMNIVDGTRGTFWTRNVYLHSPVTKVTTVLEFDLGIGKDANYIVIEGATEVPFTVESVQGIAPDGHQIDLVSASQEINGKTRIDFDRSLLRSVKVTFSLLSYIKADYILDPKDAIMEVFDGDTAATTEDLVEMFGPLATEVLASETLADIINVPDGISEQVDSFVYPFALDNVWFGNSLYEDSGIFVSRPLKGQNFGVIAVQANESLTVPPGHIQNSIEYEIIKTDTSPEYKETKFSIPRLGQNTVAAERLVLTKRVQDSTIPDAGALRFCPHVDSDWTLTDDDPVQIYKNNERLVIGEDFEIAIMLSPADEKSLYWVTVFNATGSDSTAFSDYQLNPAKMWIKMLSPDPSAIYTASYTIRTSDTYVDDDTVWLDINKTVFLSDGGRVYFRRENPDVTIESEVHLQITLRRNTAIEASTPILTEYAVLGATFD